MKCQTSELVGSFDKLNLKVSELVGKIWILDFGLDLLLR
jgi:hypothetical protein